MSEVTQWNCQTSVMEAIGTPLEKITITVGQKFYLHCSGADVALQKEALNFELEDAYQHVIKILEVRDLKSGAVDLVVTGYRVGEFNGKPVVLGDSKSKVDLNGINFKVESVLKTAQGQKPEPYPAYGPFRLSIPLIYWILLAIVVLIPIVIFTVFWRRRMRRRKFLQRVELLKKGLSPLLQLHKELRRISRNLVFNLGDEDKKFALHAEGRFESKNTIDEIAKAFHQYLMTEFLVEADRKSSTQVLREFKKSWRDLYDAVGKDLQSALYEIEKAQREHPRVRKGDCEQLIEMCRNLAEKLAKLRETRS
jgi:hypothetical protein